MNFLIHALLEMASGGAPRAPRIDPLVGLVALGLGVLTGTLMYRQLFGNGELGVFAWLLIPMSATFIVATVLDRGHGIRGGFLAAGVALCIGVPFAIGDLMLSFW